MQGVVRLVQLANIRCLRRRICAIGFSKRSGIVNQVNVDDGLSLGRTIGASSGRAERLMEAGDRGGGDATCPGR